VKTLDMDCGFKIQEAQGVKREEKDMSANTFELGLDGGLIPEKPEGSLAKRLAEAVPSVLAHWIWIQRSRSKLIREPVRGKHIRWIWI
jgi:hypothetical protein